MVAIKGALLLSAVLVGATAAYLAAFLGYHLKVAYNDDGCVLIPGISPGSEDIAVVDNTLALVSAGDIDRIYFKSGNPPRPGGLFALWLDSSPRAVKVPLEGYPDGMSFNPHGIHFSNATQRVYAVNHDCGEHLLEGIEIFKLVRGGDGNDRALKLEYERSISSPSFPFGSLNDVVEGRLGEIYVTQWMARPMDENCKMDKGVMDGLGRKIDALFRRRTKIHRCFWDISDSSKPASCSVAAEGFMVANGITSDPDKNQIYAIDSAAHELRVYTRNKNDGSLSLKDIIYLQYGSDNVEFDVASGKLTLSASPLLYQVIGRMDGDASIQVSGGMVTVEPLQNGTYIIEEVLMHDGSKLSFISSCVFANGKILMGSPASDGVLVCPIPDQPLSSKRNG